MSHAEIPVLIVGGGVVGLSAALFLARAQVPCLLVEKHPTTSIQPRARGVNGRTMELMRELGLEAAIRETGAQLAPAVGIHAGPDLKGVLERQGEGGVLLRRMRRRGLSGQPQKNSPTGPCRCTQDLLEPLLLRAARARGVQARFGCELAGLSQDELGVTATLLDRQTGARSEHRARYVIAADGARGRVGGWVGIDRHAIASGGHLMNLYFRADLRELVAGREFSLCVIDQPDLHGLYAAINNRDLWVLHVTYDPQRGQRPDDFSPERCCALIRQATGLPQLEIELKGALPWRSAALIASRYRSGRVFVAGDSAHSMPPWGGFGANTGIQDAHNLAWKLAAAVSGNAGPHLLDTYEAERRPVGLAVARLAASLNDERGLIEVGRSPLFTLWNMRKIFPYQLLGYGYSSEAIVREPGTRPGPGTTALTGLPGTRLPHVWLTRSGCTDRKSSLDLVGPGWLWLSAPRAAHWHAAGLELQHGGATLVALQLDRDLQALDGARIGPRARWRAFGLGDQGALLVRPDGFVAFRTRGAPRSAAAASHMLRELYRQALGHPAGCGSAQPMAAGLAAR